MIGAQSRQTSLVERLQRAFQEAKVEAQTYFDFNAQLVTELSENQQKAEKELKALRAEDVNLLEEKKQLRRFLDDLNATHNALMAHSLAQTEQIGDIRS